MSVRGWEAHPKVREGLGVPPEGPVVVGRPTQRSRSPSQRSKRVQETLPEKGEGGPREGPGGVGCPSQRYGGPPGDPGVVRRAYQRSGRNF